MKIPGFLSRESEESQAVDLRLSGRWVIGLLVLVSTVVMILSIAQVNKTFSDVHSQNLALAGFLLTICAVMLYSWRPDLGIVSVLIGLVVLILIDQLWMHLFNSLVFLFIPVILAAILYSLRLSLIFAVVETLLTLLMLSIKVITGSDTLSAVALTWIAFSLLFFIYQPVYQAVNWYRSNYNMVKAELEIIRSERQERKQLIEELDQANRQLAAIYRKSTILRQIAEDSEKSKATFVAKVSHEFRTPLSMIIGLSGLVLEDNKANNYRLPEEVIGDITIIHRNSEHLAKLVNDVLDLTRSETGQLKLKLDWADISLEVKEAVMEISPLLEKKNLRLVLDLPEDLPKVYCDQIRIRQVILNLVGNAAHYTEKGEIQISVHNDDRYITIDIADSGPGIPDSDLEMIFEPFTRGPNRPPDEIGSSGLGLSISRQFVELHGGDIWVRSELDKGSTFSFKIPIRPMDPTYASPARWISAERIWHDRKSRVTVDSSPTRKKVLVYDTGGELVHLLHGKEDVDFEPVFDVETAIERSKLQSVAVVLVNGHTPEQTLKIVDECRSRLFDTPVVGCVYPPYLEQLREYQVVSYLMKPIILEEIQTEVQNAPGLKQRILIVDDDRDLCKVLERMLSKINENCQTFVASSGEKALQMMPEIKPDLVILDIIMGGMNGWEVLEVKNRSAELAKIPVIILSGQDRLLEHLTSPVMFSAFGAGLNIDKILYTALDFSEIMFQVK